MHWLNKPVDELQQYTVMTLKAWVRNARTISWLYFEEQKAKIKLAIKIDGHLYPSQMVLATANSSESTDVADHRE